MNRPFPVACAALALVMLATAPVTGKTTDEALGNAASTRGESDRQSLLGKASDLWMEHGADVTETVSADHNSAALGDLSEALKDDAADSRNLASKLSSLAHNPKMSPELKAEGLNSASDLRQGAETQVKAAGFAEKVGKVLDIIDMVSTTAKASAYASEGDYTGATSVLVGETAKKLIEAAGAFGLSWLPGGQLLGTLAGEKLYADKVEPVIADRENQVRDKEYADRYLNKPWMPANEVMDETGKIRTLPPDMYVEKGTGLIKSRSPEEQTAYEDSMHTQWLDALQWGKIMKDLASGKIDQARYDELRDAYRNRDFTKPWDPNAVNLLGAGRFAGSYTGSFSGGGSGSIHLTIAGNQISGSLSGVCTTNPCENDPVSGTISGTVSDLGIIRTRLTGQFNISDSPVGPIGFAGSLNGMIDGKSAGGEWSGHNKYGNPNGRWSAARR